MRTLLKIIWLVLAGLWLALGYAIAGVIMCILIVTIPFGLQAFKRAGYSLWPFGRTVVKRPEAERRWWATSSGCCLPAGGSHCSIC